LAIARSGTRGHIEVNLDRLVGPTNLTAAHDGTITERDGEALSSCLAQVNSRFTNYLLDVSESKDRKVSSFYPGLSSRNYWPVEQFQLAADLSKEWHSIRSEILTVDRADFHEEAENIQRSGRWDILMLLEAGVWQEDNLRKLPLLTRVLKNSADVRLAGGLAYLSRLSPRTSVAPHSGPTNMRLRLHFAVTIPRGDCALNVGGESRQWVEGQALVFDDYLQHEVWNRTDEERLILLVDVWHPELTLQERKMLEAIHWMATEHGKGLAQYWKKNHDACGERLADRSLVAERDDLVL
jgi:aspartyl/asparaginyl beta-hydroxylase (cupin superfamily)